MNAQQVVEGHGPRLDGQHGEHPGDRLGHREHDVSGRPVHSVEVPLDHHLSPVQHQKPVGVGVVEHLLQRPGPSVAVVDRQAVQVDEASNRLTSRATSSRGIWE